MGSDEILLGCTLYSGTSSLVRYKSLVSTMDSFSHIVNMFEPSRQPLYKGQNGWPNVSFIQRFHCNYKLGCDMLNELVCLFY